MMALASRTGLVILVIMKVPIIFEPSYIAKDVFDGVGVLQLSAYLILQLVFIRFAVYNYN